MWISVDRVENGIVVMISDDMQIYHLDTAAYEALTGLPPKETHVLWCEVRDGIIVTARFDPEETHRRINAARERLQRLLHLKNNRKG